MRFQCPLCKGIVSADNSDMGSSVQCGHCGKPVTVPSSRTASGSVIGDFIILHELGRGGMGVVYLAHQISLDRPAALKILAESYAKNAEYVVGFIKEARAAAKLNHPNIVQAYAVGDDDGIFYFAMEHVDGETMSNILKRETKLKVDQAIDIIRQIAEALDYAWQEEKLVHRDIKPDNIMLTSSGRAKLADLGLAKVGNETGSTDGEEVMGTPQYISPEQLTGEELDNRTDIYCLGATFYHLLTGRFPYEGATAVEIARQHLEGTLVPPWQVNPDIPESVSRVVEKMMEKEPANRYQNAGLLAEDLALIKRGQNPASPAAGSVGRKAAPKLHVPGKKAANGSESGTGTRAAGDSAVPKLSLAGNKPKISLANHPATSPADAASSANSPNPAKPKLVSKPVSAPAPEPDPEDASPVVKKKKRKNDQDSGSGVGKIIVKIIVGLLVLAVLGAAGTFCYFKFVKKQDPVQVLTQAKEVIGKVGEKPKPSEFMMASEKIIGMIRSGNAGSPAAAGQCYTFLKNRMVPETEEEKAIQQEIIAYFAGQDESEIEKARMKAAAEYENEQQRKLKAAAEAAKARMEAERRAQVAAAERRVREEEQKRQNAERAKLQRQKKNFENQMNYRIQQMILDLARYGESKHDRAGLNEVFERNIAIRESVPRPDWLDQQTYLRCTGQVINQARALQKTMQQAWKWEKIFAEGDPRLIGMNIELRFNICTVTGIKNGVIKAKAGSKEFAESVDQLLNNKKFRQFALAAAGRLNEKDSLPFYFFWRGAYPAASLVALDISDKGRRAYSAFVQRYLTEAWRDPKIRPLLLKKFRGVPEYDRMNPVRRAPVRRPPPRKAPPKKAPPKKAPPKKKK